MIPVIAALAFIPNSWIETAVADYNSLHNLICHEQIVRTHNHKIYDVIDATVLLSTKGEVYSDIINDRNKHFDSIRMCGKFWSQGEYAGLLGAAIIALTSRDYDKSQVNPDGTVDLTYFITREQSAWTLTDERNNTWIISYSLQIGFSPDHRIRYLGLTSHDVKPGQCGYYVSVDTALQRVGDDLYLVPVFADTARTFQNAKPDQNEIHFTGYRQFHVESTLITADSKIVPQTEQ